MFELNVVKKCRFVIKLGKLQNKEGENRSEFYKWTYEKPFFVFTSAERATASLPKVGSTTRGAGSALVGLWTQQSRPDLRI